MQSPARVRKFILSVTPTSESGDPHQDGASGSGRMEGGAWEHFRPSLTWGWARSAHERRPMENRGSGSEDTVFGRIGGGAGQVRATWRGLEAGGGRWAAAGLVSGLVRARN